jgi:hypothetical protein
MARPGGPPAGDHDLARAGGQRATAISSSTTGPPPTGKTMYCLPPDT